jgi:hypothetical protein
MKTAFYKSLVLLFVLSSLGFVYIAHQVSQQVAGAASPISTETWTPEGFAQDNAPVNMDFGNPAQADTIKLAERPLMSQTRKPFVAEAVQPEPEPPPPPPEEPVPVQQVSTDGFRLIGLIDDGDAKRALIITPNQPIGAWYKLADTVEGYTLKDIKPNAVIIEVQGQLITLKQYVEKQQ